MIPTTVYFVLGFLFLLCLYFVYYFFLKSGPLYTRGVTSETDSSQNTQTLVVQENFENTQDDAQDDAQDGSQEKKQKEVKKEAQEDEETTESKPVLVNIGTQRRDSKVGSSLEFAYIDEATPHSTLTSCASDKENLESPKVEISPPFLQQPKCQDKPFLKETKPKFSKKVCFQDQKPAPPSSQPVCKEKSKDDDTEEVMPHPDLYDKYLEPKPDVDSPYGFVYFPNKYWKQWQQKAPVCVPTSPCVVQPTATNGVPVDVLDYTQIGSIMPKFEYTEEYQK